MSEGAAKMGELRKALRIAHSFIAGEYEAILRDARAPGVVGPRDPAQHIDPGLLPYLVRYERMLARFARVLEVK